MITLLKVQLSRWNSWQGLSTNRRIFAAMVVVAAMTGTAKLALVAKELVVSGYFGTGEVVDAFLIAFLLPMFAVSMLAGSFSAAMMPAYIRARDDAGIIAAQRLFSSVMVLGILFLITATLVLAASAPLLLPLLGSGFEAQTMVLTQSLFYWLLPLLLLNGIGHLYATAINAGERFAVVALTPAITPIFAVAALVLFVDIIGIHALVAGTLLGAIIELAILAKSAAKHNIYWMPRWHGISDELRAVMAQYAPMVAGAFLMSGTVLVDQAMAAMLESGSVATLNYANRVVAMLLGIGAMALGTAVLPHFSRMVAANDWAGVRHTFKTYARLILLFSVPVTAVLFLFSESIIELLFERGAFSAEDTRLVGQVQAFYLLQVPFYLISILGVRLISSVGKNEVLMKISAVNLVVNIIGNYLFMQYFGVVGIALSTALVYALSCGMILFYLMKELDNGR